MDEQAVEDPDRDYAFVESEMREYENVSSNNNPKTEQLNQEFRAKSNKKVRLDIELTNLEMNFSLLMLQDVMGLVRLARKAELERVRNKLIKLENHLAFKLEGEDL